MHCISPAIRAPSPSADETVVLTDALQATRANVLPPASLPDTHVRERTVAAPSAGTLLPGADGCGPPVICGPIPARRVEDADSRRTPLREPEAPLLSSASARVRAALLSWFGLWFALWLTFMGLFGLGAWVFYKRRLAPEVRLIRAAEAGLRGGEFRLEYQPVMSLRRGGCVGVEAMIRWNNAEYGSRGPAYYMRLLGKTRLSGRLTRFVLSTATQELAEVTAGSALFIGVHVSATHVESKSFASDVSRSARSILSQLVLNMPQRGCAVPTADVLHTVATLRAQNVRFALTNVDEVPSYRDRLEMFGFEQIKIDRHIMTLDEEELRQRLRSVVRAVRPLGATVVAEGVESASHHAVISQAGVDLAQGFFFGRTMTLSLLLTFLEAGGISLRMRKKGRWN
jgi:EAL domain-containing protein (putative c-di-GMP-specific phosphodiesterase class I)